MGHSITAAAPVIYDAPIDYGFHALYQTLGQQRSDLVHFCWRQGPGGGFDIVQDVLQARGARDHGTDLGLGHQPGLRQLVHAAVTRRGPGC